MTEPYYQDERPTPTWAPELLARAYYSDDSVVLIHGDYLDPGIVPFWAAGDVLITDPPYGVGGKLSFGSASRYRPHNEFGQQTWDTTLDVRDAVLAAWGDRPAAAFGSPRRLDAAPPHREVPLIWDKGDTVATGDTTFPWRPTYELIYINGGGWRGFRGTAVLRSQHHSHTARMVGHPTPKPVDLMTHLVDKAPPGVVVDPFAGSGSTLIAAKLAGRGSVGVEIDERYAEVAARRLSQDVLDFGTEAGA